MRSQHEDKIQAAILLQDKKNCANHCFGIHHNCKPKYCKTAKSKTTNTSHANGQANASSSYTPPQNFIKLACLVLLPKQVRFYTYLKTLLNTLKWMLIALISFYRNSSAIEKMPLIPMKLLTTMRIWTHHSL